MRTTWSIDCVVVMKVVMKCKERVARMKDRRNEVSRTRYCGKEWQREDYEGCCAAVDAFGDSGGGMGDGG